ncbi:MAG TPA: hypothetical protein HPP77_06045 [Candidatus Hydrogenedentes bacterium]|nr:hypothetical protein [Candidatus Hydrogenedentota bacterium]
MNNLEGFFSVKDYGAAADGKTDDSAAIQRAIDAAAAKGGNVYLPPGEYCVAGSLEVKRGVTVTGVHEAPVGFTGLSATIIRATGGKGNDDFEAPALFELRDSSAVRYMTVYYPEQDVDDIQPYPFTFHMYESDNTVECVTLINSHKGIRVGPEHNCRHRIRSVHGCVLRYGIWVDNTWEIGRVENCQLHPHWWASPKLGGDWRKVTKYMAENLETFVFARTDWEYVTNNFIFSAKIGYRFIHTKHGECNGHLTACGADGTQTALQVDRIQRMGLLITGGEFVSLAGDDPCQIRVMESSDQGSIRFVNCAFWGMENRVALLRGASYVSFNDCYFTNWKKGVDENHLIVAETGRLQLNNCTFDTHHPAVMLGQGLAHAVVQGNNGVNGVTIADNTGGKAYIAGNEPPAAEANVIPFGITRRPREGGTDEGY